METAAPIQRLRKGQPRRLCRLCRRWIKLGDEYRQSTVYGTDGQLGWEHTVCAERRAVNPQNGNGHAAPAGPLCDEEARSAVRNLSTDHYKLRNRVADLEAKTPKVIEVKVEGKAPVTVNGAVHPAFQEVLELAQAREHIFLPGPAGCGKSHLAGQVAEALGLKFGFISCSAGMSESQLLGRMVPGADGKFEFLGTAFLDCYENGGVFLFDELDAADSNVLLVINSALANGRLAVPSRHAAPVACRHADFVCIAAANTYGKGADRQYVGRNELDESTLDRFRIGTVPMDYDELLETALCPNDALRQRLWGYRARIQENRLERLVSTRFIAAAYRAVSRGKDCKWVDAKLFAGWRADEVVKVRGGAA